MRRKLFVSILLVVVLALAGLTTASASSSYSPWYMKFVSTSYYYLLATDHQTGYPWYARNLVTTHTPSTYNSNWIVRCLCCNGDITFNFWHKSGDYTYTYEDYEHSLTGEKLVARPNSSVAGVTVGGTFWGDS